MKPTRKSLKATRIIALYAAGERNFCGHNLNGISLRGQCLRDANFSQADIRGTDFSNADLYRTRFSQATGGIRYSIQQTTKLFAAFWGLLSGFVSTRIAVLLVSSEVAQLSKGVACTLILILICTAIRGFGLLKGLVIASSVVAALGISMGAASVLFQQISLGDITLEATETSIMVGVAIAMLCLMLAVSQAADKRSTLWWACLGAVAGATSVPLMSSGYIAENLGLKGTVLAIIVALSIVIFCVDLGSHAIAGNPKYALIRRFVVVVMSSVGTCFQGANLSYADFSEAQLLYTDWRTAKTRYTHWKNATGLALSRWSENPLKQATTRQLLTTRQTHKNLDLREANLAYTDLANLNLQAVNLRGANLFEANLQNADLRGANLTLVKALGTDLTGAILTGSCIEGWIINGQTNLDNVVCRFIYRQEGHHQSESRHQDKSSEESTYQARNPSSGEFDPGDFTQLFQVVLDTVELIFRNGIDRDAIQGALSQVQSTIDERIKFRGIEDKGNGFFKVALGVPEGVEKAAFHHEFEQLYQMHLQQLENRYEAQLNSAQHQITHYQKTTSELTQIVKQLTGRSIEPQRTAPTTQCVTLTFWDGSLEQGAPVTADIRMSPWAEPLKVHASLSPAPELAAVYQRWQRLYRQSFNCARIQLSDDNELTNISYQELHLLAEQLSKMLQDWLQSASFRPIADKLRETFLPEQEICLIFQTENIGLRRLPWHMWQFLTDYPKTEIALSGMSLETPQISASRHQKKLRNHTRLLAVMGSSTGIDLSVDQQLLAALSRSSIEVVFSREPSLQQFHESLWDEVGWDIFYFSGHSHSQQDGYSGTMQLSSFSQISMEDLRFALAEAVDRGLQLALINSCDGLGLARELCTLKIPQIVVMKEPVPDIVAQQFLDYFLQALTKEKTLYAAIGEARRRLCGLEDRYPYASWLPTLFQTTTEGYFSAFSLPNSEIL